MRSLIQRVSTCEVWIDGRLHSSIGCGLLILFGTRTSDGEESCAFLADKAINLRIFEDAHGKMNLSLLDVAGEIMIVSQFTLYADARKGRRPSFTDAMEPVEAERLYNCFVQQVGASGLVTRTGQFGAKMEVRLANNGPVTIMLEHDVPEHS
jgi:D-tyrosyl-tRNA(Tyr) deacylase